MMFPANSPMVLLYDRLIKNTSSNETSSARQGEAKESLIVVADESREEEKMRSSISFWSPYSLKMMLFCWLESGKKNKDYAIAYMEKRYAKASANNTKIYGLIFLVSLIKFSQIPTLRYFYCLCYQNKSHQFRLVAVVMK